MDSWTNVPYIAEDLDCCNKKILIWHDYRNDITIEHFRSLPQWNHAKKIFIVGQEAEFANFVFEDPRIHVWDSLYLPDRDRFYSYFFWWHQVKQIEYYQNNIYKLTNPLQKTPEKIFEFLIRTAHRAPQRNLIKDLIIKNNLENLVLNNFDNQWIPGTALELTDAHDLNNNSIRYNQTQTANNSSILPYRIYNQSWFSIVSESLGYKRFFTEKIAKAFLGKRLFVFIGAQYALRDLKQLGYKTFDNVIDESYDSIEDNYLRWKKAFNEVKYICQCNPETLYRKVLPILEHNQQKFLSENQMQDMIQQMTQVAENE